MQAGNFEMADSYTIDVSVDSIRVPVDVEHVGVRLGVPLLAVASLVVSLWAWPRFFSAIGQSASWLGLLAMPLALVTTIAVAFAGDRLIKKFWTSGRELELDRRQLVLRKKGQADQAISWDAHVNVLYWRFNVPRRGRVPKGHFCLAAQLLQDEEMVTIYTFLDPKRTDEISNFDAFVPLSSRSSVKDERASMRVAGQQRRLLQAEDERWRNGAELNAADFAAVWTVLQDRVKVYQE